MRCCLAGCQKATKPVLLTRKPTPANPNLLRARVVVRDLAVESSPLAEGLSSTTSLQALRSVFYTRGPWRMPAHRRRVGGVYAGAGRSVVVAEPEDSTRTFLEAQAA